MARTFEYEFAGPFWAETVIEESKNDEANTRVDTILYEAAEDGDALVTSWEVTMEPGGVQGKINDHYEYARNRAEEIVNARKIRENVSGGHKECVPNDIGAVDLKVNKTIEIDEQTLERLADYVSDDLKQHMSPEDSYLEDAVRNAYDALDN